MSHALTEVAGSSAWYLGGIVSYANEVKVRHLGVSASAIQQFGAVSTVVAGQMARGMVLRFGADIGVAITGIAGPSGATVDKPVGTVCFGYRFPASQSDAEVRYFKGNRAQVRTQAMQHAVQQLLNKLQ